MTSISSVIAALPPYFNRVDQLKTVLESEELSEKLGSGTQITSLVASNSPLSFIVKTTSKKAVVVLRASEPPFPGFVGPTHYEIDSVKVSTLK